ncbi:hypothetical protein K491DRAFT_426841 [Lophiostoma macrostomum CBS 122681]|uniref:HMG box domain-containing protein n=1 Tax=Lophiostoma macrostomum CBS 122681 TaxID=1314788 RepID=A0A6A6T6D5_9PLEO|nr:hypothetical protein K491DRAFT_426841 [Lophiostoma macrostomum CBS 122681]
MFVPELSEVLGRLRLTQYLNVLIDNGFHTWETVLDITEYDLTALNFKLGHRRILQREIATFRGIPRSLSLEPESMDVDQPPFSPSSRENSTVPTTSTSPPPREKRRYRRHPHPDNNAPKKPKTAYVNFADKLREEPDISALSFVDIAKEVGRRWQVLPPEQKRIWESHAARAMQEHEVQMDEYKKTDSWRKYQNYLSDFKSQQTQPPKEKRPTAPRIDSFMTGDSSRASPVSSDVPSSLPSFTSTGTESEICHNALTLAFSELVSLRGEILADSSQAYDEKHLPSEELTRRAMYAFVSGTGSLVYMWTVVQVDEILDRIYRPTKPVDAMTLAECFTVAAMGAHYDMDCFPDRIRRMLYASATLYFHERLAQTDYLRTMRLLLSMSFYAILEKHMSARYLIAAGLQVARWKCPPLQQLGGNATVDNGRRLFRSLIFMDSWLSYTLGYPSEVAAEDIAFVCIPHAADGRTMDELIHIQTSRIGLIAAEITKTLGSPELTTRANIDSLKHSLEVWQTELPPILQMATLTSSPLPELTSYQKRAIFMVHMMYLGALILLYRTLLVATAETQLTDGAAWSLDLSIEDARRYRHECSVAGQQMARVLGLISFDRTLTKRCWMMIYWSFTASIVLLFSAMTKLLDHRTGGVDEDLTYAKFCIEIMEPCRVYEPVARRYLDIIWPLYNSLRSIYQRMSKAKTSISMLLQTDPGQMSPYLPVNKEEMAPISTKLSALVMDPFGRNQDGAGDDNCRRMLNSDGSCSVFWWK